MAETNEKDTTKSEIFIARVFCLIASPLSLSSALTIHISKIQHVHTYMHTQKHLHIF
ncbi:unnamed protein product, partial [Arabidopsis halleri]